ncbi:MAG TPA: hypothetical protein VK137_13135 [Planctomycetaceae bacterium]|nr:hypothetical protein [Planctomycetaceae bacterium]
MQTSHVGVYHCLCCGSVVEQERRRLPPFCCGLEMTRAYEYAAASDELIVPSLVTRGWIKTVGDRTGEQELSPRPGFVAKQPLQNV